jgi:tripartite-type tricarboxylate transporter receptor subunit TctC
MRNQIVCKPKQMRSNKLRLLIFSIAISVSFTGLKKAYADDVAAFYKGKQIQFLIGGNAGVSYDLTGRTLAAHIVRHIPGNPTIRVENMPGASSVIMMNHLYNRSPRDGTVIGAPLNNILLEPRLKLISQQGGSINFDLRRMNWLGSPVQEPQVMWVWHTTGVKSVASLKGAKVIMGGTSVGADNHTLPSIVNSVFGTKIEIVLGYKGPTDVFLAAERGEVHGISTAHSTLMATRKDWVTSGKVNILVQFGASRAPDLPDVPTATEIAPDSESRQLFEFIASKFVLARPYVLPPDVPPERVVALRNAFDSTMKDPAFLADAAKVSLDINPVNAREMERVIENIEKTPTEVINRIRAIFQK